MSTTTTAMGSGSQCDRDRDEFTSIAERWGYRSDGGGERAARLPSVGQERTRAIAVASSSDLGLTE